MPKSNLQKLKEAIERGDLEEAKRLTAKIDAGKKKTKPKPKSTRSPKKVKAKPSQPPKKTTETTETLLPDNNFLAPTFPEGGRTSGSRTVERNGEARTIAGMAPVVLSGENLFKDCGKYTNPIDRKVDKIINKMTPSPRRPPDLPFKVNCEGCGRSCEVYADEMRIRYNDDRHTEQYYRCNRCDRGR